MAFCFGVAPVALHLEASMAAPERLRPRSGSRCSRRSRRYVIVGAGVARLYDGPDVNDSVPGNVLDALPTGVTPTIVRLAMAAACVASIPIGLVGCGEILEARIPRCRRLVVRGLVAVAAALVAYAMPAFALVVGLVGAVAVCTLSFALPPLVHLLLARRNGLPLMRTPFYCGGRPVGRGHHHPNGADDGRGAAWRAATPTTTTMSSPFV